MKLTDSENELLANAFKRQSLLRLKAFANGKYEYEVAGEKLASLTLSDVCELYMNGNSFVAGGTLAVIDAVQVLWIACDKSEKRNDAGLFTRRLLKRYTESELIEIAGNFVDDMFLDSGDFVDDDATENSNDADAKRKPPYYTMASLIVAEIARVYHWNAEDILKMPLPQVWQFLHLARKSENPKYNWRQLTDHINIIIRRRRRNKNNGKN